MRLPQVTLVGVIRSWPFDPERRLHVLEDLVGVVARVELQRIREDHRQAAEARGIAVGDVVARDAGRAEDRAGAGLAEDAPAERVLALPVGRLEERRRSSCCS